MNTQQKTAEHSLIQRVATLSCLVLPSLLFTSCGKGDPESLPPGVDTQATRSAELENASMPPRELILEEETSPQPAKTSPIVFFQDRFQYLDREEVFAIASRAMHGVERELNGRDRTYSYTDPASGGKVTITANRSFDQVLAGIEAALHYVQTDPRTKRSGEESPRDIRLWDKFAHSKTADYSIHYDLETERANISIFIHSDITRTRRVIGLVWNNHRVDGSTGNFSVYCGLSLYHPTMNANFRVPLGYFSPLKSFGTEELSYESSGSGLSTERRWRELSLRIEDHFGDSSLRDIEDPHYTENYHPVPDVETFERLLKSGQRDFTNYDLSGLDLRRIPFESYFGEKGEPFDFTKAKLHNTDFRGCRFVEAVFNLARINNPKMFEGVRFDQTLGLEAIRAALESGEYDQSE